MTQLNGILRHDDINFALGAFLDEFYRSENRAEMILTPPDKKLGTKQELTTLAAIIETLSAEYRIKTPGCTSARVASTDMGDSVFLIRELGIKTSGELFDPIETYTHKDRQTIASKYFTLEAFEKYQKNVLC